MTISIPAPTISITLTRPPTDEELAELRACCDPGAPPLLVRVSGTRTVQVSRPAPAGARVVLGPGAPAPSSLSSSEDDAVRRVLTCIVAGARWYDVELLARVRDGVPLTPPAENVTG